MHKNILGERLIKIISSFFGLGFSPVLPGTLASLAAVLTYFLLVYNKPVSHFILAFTIVSIGFYVCGRAEKIFAQKDARVIVIDDFGGALMGLLFLPYSIEIGVIYFFVFRIMDGLKPYPIYRIEKLSGSLGIMMDDVVSGIYANITLQIFLRLTSAIFS